MLSLETESRVPSGAALRRAQSAHRALAIFDQAVNVVVVPGASDPCTRHEAEQVVRCWGERRAITFPGAEVVRGVDDGFGELPEIAGRLRDMAELFQALTEAERVGLRVAAQRSALCPALHVDRVELRLVCSLHGPGTEFIASHEFDRGALSLRRGERRDAIEAHPSIVRANAGDWVLLKGESWVGNAGRGAIHRSPATQGALRIVATLDVVG